MSRHELTAAIHQRPASPLDRSLDVHVSHIRKKLGRQGTLIRTVRGVGYLFRAELLETQRVPLMKIRVRSIFTKIVVWAVATVVISLVGFVVTSAFVSARISGRSSNVSRGSARCSWTMPAGRIEEGGPEQLDAFLKRLKSHTEAEYFLTDGRGIDLVTGEDRSAAAVFGRVGAPAAAGADSAPHRDNRASSPRSRRPVSPDHRGAAAGPLRSLGIAMAFSLAADPDRRAVLPAGRASGLAIAESSQGGRAVRARRAGGPIRADPEGRDRRAGASIQPDGGPDHDACFRRNGGCCRTFLTSCDRRWRGSALPSSWPRPAPIARRPWPAFARRPIGSSQLVDELLQLTRAEGDPTARVLEEVDLGELLGEVVASCALEAEMRGCRLEAKIDATAVVTGDFELLAARLRQRAAQRDPA